MQGLKGVSGYQGPPGHAGEPGSVGSQGAKVHQYKSTLVPLKSPLPPNIRVIRDCLVIQVRVEDKDQEVYRGCLALMDKRAEVD